MTIDISPPARLSKLGRSALIYAVEHGWRVFPLHTADANGCSCNNPACGGPGKHPRTPRGCLDATTDAKRVHAWWTQWPDANVGIATGGGLVVLDIDPRHGGDDTLVDLRRSLGAIPDTVEVLTGGGGRHIYLASPDGVDVRNSANKLGVGVDVRGEGGYVVAPPSVHATGRCYGWEVSSRPGEVDVAPLPDAWLAAVTARPKLRVVVGAKGEPFPEGERNDSLYRRGCSMRSGGFARDAILAALTAENDDRCVPPLDPAEVKAIVESVCARPEGLSPEYQAARDSAASRRNSVARVANDGQSSAPGAPASPGDDWRDQLYPGKKGGYANTFANVCTILRHAPEYASLRYDEMNLAAMLAGKRVDDAGLGAVRESIERLYGFAPAAASVAEALGTVSAERRFHPVREYLAGLVWDGVPRLDEVAAKILGAAGPLPALMVKRFFVGAIARVMRPGCKLDTALVLQGAQGVRKSTFYRVLFGEWFTDTHVDLSSKDAYLQLAGAWGIEWGEVERVTGRRGADEIKSFLSAAVDRFRPPYGRGIVEVPRTSVLMGSTNQTTFLDDDTGSRRFWCVRVGASVDVEMLATQRDQLWAEARSLYDRGEPWWLDAADEGSRAEDAEVHAVEDAWTDPILRWVAKNDDRDEFTAAEVLTGALEMHKRDHDRNSVARATRVLRVAGWDRRKHRAVRDGVVGPPVWCWFRPSDARE